MRKFMISKEANIILQILKKNKINYKLEYTFPDLKGRKGVPFRFDFAVFDKQNRLQALIEYDSELHFNKNCSLVKDYRHYRENDLKKNRYAITQNIPLYRITCWDLKEIKTLDDIFNKKYLVTDIWHNYKIAAEHNML